jgi:hypothetical protein
MPLSYLEAAHGPHLGGPVRVTQAHARPPAHLRAA